MGPLHRSSGCDFCHVGGHRSHSEAEALMKAHHAVMMIVLLLVGYLLGVEFPALGKEALGKVGL